MVQRRIPKGATARNRVLDAARAAFAARGYHASAVRDIARRARVNEVTVFRLFGNKEHLYEAVLESHSLTEIDSPEWLSAVASAESGPVTLVDGLQRVFDPVLTRLMFFAALERPQIARKTISPRLRSLSKALQTGLELRDSSAAGITVSEALAEALIATVMYDRIFTELVSHGQTKEEVAKRIRSLAGASPVSEHRPQPMSRAKRQSAADDTDL